MGSSTTANQAGFQDAGKPVANPIYLVDQNGNPITTSNPLGVNATFSASSLAINDPTITTQKASVDASGNLHVQAVGAGTAGSPSGGVVSVQGVASGTTIPVSGTVTATNPSVGTDGSAIPTSSTLVGASDGTNLQQLLVESSSNKNLRTAVYNGANELAVDASGNASVKVVSGSTTAVTQATGSNLHAVLDAGSAVIGSTTIQATSGTSLVADQSNTELRVSNYGKNSAAGDTPLLVDSTGRVLVGRSCTAVYTLASVATSGSTQNSGDLTVGSYTEMSIDINTTAQSGTNPTIQYIYERKGADGLYYPLWQSNTLTAAANTLSTSIGTGMAYNQSLGLTGRLRWVIGGSATPTYTHSINIYSK